MEALIREFTCDRCEDSISFTGAEARSPSIAWKMAQREGWTRQGRDDLCPTCTGDLDHVDG